MVRVSADLQGENGTSLSEHNLGSTGGRRSYTLLQGHSGPVYSATFSPLGDFVLSSSADSTSKLSWTVVGLLKIPRCCLVRTSFLGIAFAETAL